MKISLPVFRKKDLVITIHGFGRRTEHEMEPLSAYLEEAGFEVWKFSYYDPEDLSDTDFRHWVARCEVRIRKALDEHRTIHLLGFSMGGVIASYLASAYPVKDLLLAAPAFYPIDFSKIEKAARARLLSSGEDASAMSSDQTRSFMSVVSRYRSSILSVTCPILILHGSSDEVIQPKSSRRIYTMIPSRQKYLVFLEGARHRFLYDGAYQSLAFPIIRDYFRGEIHPACYEDLPDVPVSKKEITAGKSESLKAEEPPKELSKQKRRRRRKAAFQKLQEDSARQGDGKKSRSSQQTA